MTETSMPETRSDPKSRAVPVCPGCGSKGRTVEPLTLKSLLAMDATAQVDEASRFRFCPVKACDIVYYGENQDVRFGAADLMVPVFQKSADPRRLVCYCFEHRVVELEEEVERTGTSTVPDQIAEMCRQGLDRCEEKNPQGVCCLGNVRAVIKAAAAKSGSGSQCSTARSGGPHDCCAAKKEPEEKREAPRHEEAQSAQKSSAGLWSAGGAVMASVLSSACCWLPLLFITVGASVGGVAAFFEAYRAVFIGGAALFLGAGFYLVYVRASRCAPGEACAVPNPKLTRWSKAMLWVATALVVGFAAFPNYLGAVLEAAEGAPPVASAHASSRTYAIDGMTCEGCTIHLEAALREIDGVASVEVSYAEKRARVGLKEGAGVPDAAVIEAIEAQGYRARPATSTNEGPHEK